MHRYTARALAHAFLLALFGWASTAPAAVAQPTPSGPPHAQAPAMQDGHGLAIGLSLDGWLQRKATRSALTVDGAPLGIGGFIRYDVARPGPQWALGLFGSIAHRTAGESISPPSLQAALRGVGSAPAADQIGVFTALNAVVVGAELRHGLLPWLVPFVRAAGGVSWVSVEVTDPSECAQAMPLTVPGVGEAGAAQACGAYKRGSETTRLPTLYATVGLTLRPAGRGGRVVAAPVGLSLEAGYLFMPNATLTPTAFADTGAGLRLADLNLSSWIGRLSLHFWF